MQKLWTDSSSITTTAPSLQRCCTGVSTSPAPQHQLQAFLGDLLARGAKAGDIRDDVAPGELASYCLDALTAASGLPTEAAARRLVTVTLAGLRTRAGPP